MIHLDKQVKVEWSSLNVFDSKNELVIKNGAGKALPSQVTVLYGDIEKSGINYLSKFLSSNLKNAKTGEIAINNCIYSTENLKKSSIYITPESDDSMNIKVKEMISLFFSLTYDELDETNSTDIDEILIRYNIKQFSEYNYNDLNYEQKILMNLIRAEITETPLIFLEYFEKSFGENRFEVFKSLQELAIKGHTPVLFTDSIDIKSESFIDNIILIYKNLVFYEGPYDHVKEFFILSLNLGNDAIKTIDFIKEITIPETYENQHYEINRLHQMLISKEIIPENITLDEGKPLRNPFKFILFKICSDAKLNFIMQLKTFFCTIIGLFIVFVIGAIVNWFNDKESLKSTTGPWISSTFFSTEELQQKSDLIKEIENIKVAKKSFSEVKDLALPYLKNLISKKPLIFLLFFSILFFPRNYCQDLTEYNLFLKKTYIQKKFTFKLFIISFILSRIPYILLNIIFNILLVSIVFYMGSMGVFLKYMLFLTLAFINFYLSLLFLTKYSKFNYTKFLINLFYQIFITLIVITLPFFLENSSFHNVLTSFYEFCASLVLSIFISSVPRLICLYTLMITQTALLIYNLSPKAI